MLNTFLQAATKELPDMEKLFNLPPPNPTTLTLTPTRTSSNFWEIIVKEILPKHFEDELIQLN